MSIDRREELSYKLHPNLCNLGIDFFRVADCQLGLYKDSTPSRSDRPPVVCVVARLTRNMG